MFVLQTIIFQVRLNIERDYLSSFEARKFFRYTVKGLNVDERRN